MYKSSSLKERQARINELKNRFRRNPAAWRSIRPELIEVRDELTERFFSAPSIEAGAPFELERRALFAFAREAADIVVQTTGERITPSDLFRDE